MNLQAWNQPPWTRRELLQRCGMGFGADFGDDASGLVFNGSGCVCQSDVSQAAPLSRKSQARHSHFSEWRGFSRRHVRPQTRTEKWDGKALDGGNLKTERKTGAVMASPFAFKKYGQSGIEVSDLFSHLGECVDDMTFVRSMCADVPNHEPSLMLMNCGEARLSRPSMGAWITYGMGTENQNLPGFVVMCPGGYPIQESDNWRSAFLPGGLSGNSHRQ